MKAIFTFVFISFFTLGAWSQSPPGPFLNSADIDRYLATGSQMMAEFESIDDPMEDEPEGETYEEILQIYQSALESNEAMKIIEKYGWETNTFGQKMMAIAMGTTCLMTEKYMKDMPPEQQAVMKEMFVDQCKALVHPDDLKLIQPKLDELEAFFEEQ